MKTMINFLINSEIIHFSLFIIVFLILKKTNEIKKNHYVFLFIIFCGYIFLDMPTNFIIDIFFSLGFFIALSDYENQYAKDYLCYAYTLLSIIMYIMNFDKAFLIKNIKEIIIWIICFIVFTITKKIGEADFWFLLGNMFFWLSFKAYPIINIFYISIALIFIIIYLLYKKNKYEGNILKMNFAFIPFLYFGNIFIYSLFVKIVKLI